jgi:hypothetical protein
MSSPKRYKDMSGTRAATTTDGVRNLGMLTAYVKTRSTCTGTGMLMEHNVGISRCCTPEDIAHVPEIGVSRCAAVRSSQAPVWVATALASMPLVCMLSGSVNTDIRMLLRSPKPMANLSTKVTHDSSISITCGEIRYVHNTRNQTQIVHKETF